jgi:hypothetical protein
VLTAAAPKLVRIMRPQTLLVNGKVAENWLLTRRFGDVPSALDYSECAKAIPFDFENEVIVIERQTPL